MKWFDNLPPRLVTCFDELARKFLTKFSFQKDKVKHASSLLGIKQEVRETLWDYMGRFNKACLEIHNLPTEAVIMALVNSLKEGPFSQSISKRHPTSLYEVQERVEEYINIEEKARLRELLPKSSLLYPPQKKEKEAKKKEEYNSEKTHRYHSYTFLRVSLVDVYREICHTEKLPPPRPIRHKKAGSRNEYYEYHKLYRHLTNDFYDLKIVIEKLAREGRLDRYLVERPEDPRKRRRDEEAG
nr:uncharacterized protein LOC112777245 [Arachis hypogaea]